MQCFKMSKKSVKNFWRSWMGKFKQKQLKYILKVLGSRRDTTILSKKHLYNGSKH